MEEAKSALMFAVREVSGLWTSTPTMSTDVFNKVYVWKKEWYDAQLTEFRRRYPGVEPYPGAPNPG